MVMTSKSLSFRNFASERTCAQPVYSETIRRDQHETTDSAMQSILIIDDNPALLEGLSAMLRREGYEIRTERTGAAGYVSAMENVPDIIVLDLGLPDMDGLDICRQLRDKDITVPILMLTARNKEEEIVAGLEQGADDYLPKPFGLAELLFRVRALLRRAEVANRDRSQSFGNVRLDAKACEVSKNGTRIPLTTTEVAILAYFLRRPRQLITRTELLRSIWGYQNIPKTRAVDNFILSLRKKTEDDPTAPRHLLTIHNAGYKFVP